MADCTEKLVQDIQSDCETQPLGGVEAKAYLINRKDIATITPDATNPSMFTDITLIAGTKAHVYKGVKKNINAGAERVIADNMADRFKHKLNIAGFQFDAASIENLDNMNDIVVITERKDKTSTNGTFAVLGITTGLFVASDAGMYNDANGVRLLELATQDEQGEKHYQNNFFDTDIETTRAKLEALLIEAV